MPGPVVPDSRHFSILNKMQRIQEGKAIEMQKRKKRILVFPWMLLCARIWKSCCSFRTAKNTWRKDAV